MKQQWQFASKVNKEIAVDDGFAWAANKDKTVAVTFKTSREAGVYRIMRGVPNRIADPPTDEWETAITELQLENYPRTEISLPHYNWRWLYNVAEMATVGEELKAIYAWRQNGVLHVGAYDCYRMHVIAIIGDKQDDKDELVAVIPKEIIKLLIAARAQIAVVQFVPTTEMMTELLDISESGREGGHLAVVHMPGYDVTLIARTDEYIIWEKFRFIWEKFPADEYAGVIRITPRAAEQMADAGDTVIIDVTQNTDQAYILIDGAAMQMLSAVNYEPIDGADKAPVPVKLNTFYLHELVTGIHAHEDTPIEVEISSEPLRPVRIDYQCSGLRYMALLMSMCETSPSYEQLPPKPIIGWRVTSVEQNKSDASLRITMQQCAGDIPLGKPRTISARYTYCKDWSEPIVFTISDEGLAPQDVELLRQATGNDELQLSVSKDQLRG